MTLIEDVSDLLRREAIPHAVIGAAALAVHGISRSTLDQDLLGIPRSAVGYYTAHCVALPLKNEK